MRVIFEPDAEHRGVEYMRAYAEAEVSIEGIPQTLTSGGMWGIEDDAEDEYLDQIIEQEWGDASRSVEDGRDPHREVTPRGGPRVDRMENVMAKRQAQEEADDYIQIPIIAKWRQIGGDMNPGAYGALLARSDGDYIDLWEIQPVREFVGDSEAADVGFPFWTKEAGYDLEALDPSKPETKRAIESMDLGDALAEMSPPQRALAIAEALMRYGYDVGEGPAGWSKDAVPTEDGPVEWWGGVGGPEYLADEDDEFRREVLGEEDDEEEEEDEAGEMREGRVSEPNDARDVLDGLGQYLEHEGHDAPRESARIARMIASAGRSGKKAEAVLEEVNKLIDGHGIEALRDEKAWDNYYGDTIATYVNMGDTYETTLLYDVREHEFHVTSWGDWYEAYEAEQEEEPEEDEEEEEEDE